MIIATEGVEYLLSNENAPNVFIPESEILKHFGITRTTLWRWRKTKGFPRPIRKPGYKFEYSSKAIQRYLLSEAD